jgi:hypothetical protein
VGGFGELVKHGENGYLHPPDDLGGFTASLRTLIDDAEQLGRFRARSRVLAAGFDLCGVGQAYETLLKRVAGEAADPNGFPAQQPVGR